MTKKQVTFFENGRVKSEGFSSLWELQGFLQSQIFQNWDHPVFKSLVENILKGNSETVKSSEEPSEEVKN